MDSGIVVFGLVLGLIVWLSFLQKVVRARRSGSWKRSVLGFSVRVSDSRQPGDYPFRTRVVVGSGSKISCSPAGHAGVSTGDAEFDKTVRLQGPEDLVLASLDADARRSIAALVGMGGEVKPNGDIVLQHNGQLYIPDLGARVTILDEHDKVVANLGDGLELRNKKEEPAKHPEAFFFPHALTLDSKGNLYVIEWLPNGRPRKLSPLQWLDIDTVGKMMCCASIGRFAAISTARSRRFTSSRTLPGHG